MRKTGYLVLFLTLAGVIPAVLGFGFLADAGIAEDVPGSLGGLAGIGDALDSADGHPVHILYVHGIDATGDNDSQLLRESICAELKLCAVKDWQSAGREYADQGEFAPDAPAPSVAYLGQPIWSNDRQAEDWRAAAPFVEHWVAHLKGYRATLIVDEMNWWPLVFALKCRKIVSGDALLAGPNKSLLELCSKPPLTDKDHPERFTQYQWISSDEAKNLESKPNRAVWGNRALKTGLLDWGFSDAMLGVGPLQTILRDGLRQLIVKSAAFHPSNPSAPKNADNAAPANAPRTPYPWKQQLQSGTKMDQEFVAVTHSMGSYLLLDTLDSDLANSDTRFAAPALSSSQDDPVAGRKATEDQAIQYIWERTSLLYFFANQIPLLELANLQPGTENSGPATSALGTMAGSNARRASEGELLKGVAQYQAKFQERLHPGNDSARKRLQVVAWSDPSDLLTWRVPPLGGVNVVNLYVQNGFHWFWIFESPTAAHDNYAKNKRILRAMFGNKAR